MWYGGHSILNDLVRIVQWQTVVGNTLPPQNCGLKRFKIHFINQVSNCVTDKKVN